MKYLKKFESISSEYTDIKVSESKKIKSLPGFNFTRVYSSIGYYYLTGTRNIVPMEYINIKKEGNEFEIHIKRAPGYFKSMISAGMPGWEKEWSNRECDVRESFDDIESLIKFLSNFNWYDVIQQY